MSPKLFIITDWYCAIFAILTIVGNSAILYLFFTKRLDSRRNLRIVLYMAATDIIFSILIIPQIVYMTLNWNPFSINYNSYYMAFFGSPLPMFFKVSSGLNAGAAMERILALYFPILYRKVDHIKWYNILLLFSVFLGSIDSVLSIWAFRFEERINCSSLGCFVNDIFRTYWGASNMVCGLLVMVMSVLVFFKVQKLGQQTGWLGATPAERKKSMANTQKFRQANRTTCGILVSTLFCLTIPSILVSMVETITGFSVFETFGPFYAAALLTSGNRRQNQNGTTYSEPEGHFQHLA